MSARDPRLDVFAGDGTSLGPVPSAAMVALADELSGRDRRASGASDNELSGLVRFWAAVESWAGSARLGAVREMMRRDGDPVPGAGHGDLPEEWSASLRHELALTLACSVQAAEATAVLAWELQARLPGIAALLDDGTVTVPKARAVAEAFRYLTDGDAARAEALVLARLAGKAHAQVMRLAEQAALTVDPGLAARRRQEARKDARVSLFRELSGAAALSGRDLPPDEALAALASVNARAEEYRESEAFGEARMDVVRAQAYLDLLNGVAAEARIAAAVPFDERADAAEALAWAQARSARDAAAASAAAEDRRDAAAGVEDKPGDSASDVAAGGAKSHGDAADAGERRGDIRGERAGSDDACAGCNYGGGACGRGCNCGEACGLDGCACCGANDGPDGDHRPDDEGWPGDDTPEGEDKPADGSGPGGGGAPGSGGHGSHGDEQDHVNPGTRTDTGPAALPDDPLARRRRPADLIVPLLTLLGLAERPGEVQGFGLLDPDLARDLAAAAVEDSRTEVCVTVTSPEGYAIAHGCARPNRKARNPADHPASRAGLPARLNLTIPVTALPRLANHNRRTGPWDFTPDGNSPPSRTGPPGNPDHSPDAARSPDDHGTWTLTLPGGRRFIMRLDPVPTFECDHRHETPRYTPSDKLRHLVQIRDGTCTFPSCNRHARESDFEHALPYDQGGRTCACNAGARSRACHRVKQSKGWNVTQPRPGWHQWTTPSGRVYTQEPKRYPA